MATRKANRQRKQGIAALVAILVPLILSACASQEPEAQPLDLQQIRENTTEFQLTILEDGVVTAEEYERAVLSQRQCVQEVGAIPGEVYETGNNELTFDWEARANTEVELDAINVAAEQCLTDYLVDVGQVWAFQQLLTEDEREEIRPIVIECLNQAGVPVDSGAELEAIAELIGTKTEYIEAARPCVEEYPGFFYVAPNDEEHDH